MVNWENILGGLVLLIIMALLVERASAFVFTWRAWRKGFGGLDGKGLKSLVVLAMAYIMCRAGGFSILALAYGADRGEAGTILTSLVVAGGAKQAFELLRQAISLRAEVRPELPDARAPR